eukprot:XP_001710201.1 Hypothetical protein GL50803_38368 [Giardia lamblia ATCC 50803]
MLQVAPRGRGAHPYPGSCDSPHVRCSEWTPGSSEAFTASAAGHCK